MGGGASTPTISSEEQIFQAVNNDNIEEVKSYFSNDQSIDINWKYYKDNFGQSPLHRAAQKGYVEILKFLLEKGYNVDIPSNHFHETPLHTAAMFGKADVAKVLLDSGANINLQDDTGRTALHWVAQENERVTKSDPWLGHLETLQILLEKGPDVNITRKTALDLAIVGEKRGIKTAKDIADALRAYKSK